MSDECSLKLLRLGEFLSQDIQSFRMTPDYDVGFLFFVFAFFFAFKPKQNVKVARSEFRFENTSSR